MVEWFFKLPLEINFPKGNDMLLVTSFGKENHSDKKRIQGKMEPRMIKRTR